MSPEPSTRERLEDLLREPQRGASVVVQGPAGMGKTTLIKHALATLPVTTVRVVIQLCGRLRGHEPFAAVSSLTAPDVADPVLAAAAQIDLWCASSPVVLWVDDAHDADPGSLAVLRRLFSATAVLPLIVVLSIRPEPRRAELAGLVEQAGHRFTVDPLPDGALNAVVIDRLGAPPGPLLRRHLQVAAGNPFVLGVLLELCRRRGWIRVADGSADVDARADFPQSPQAAVRAYLAQLSPAASELATTVAALGSPADPSDVAEMMRASIASLQWSLAEAGDFGVLEWRGSAVVLRHDTYGDVLLGQLTEPLRAALHRDAARVLRARHAPDVRIAEQVLRSGESDEDLLRGVAAAAVATAPGVAADLLDHLHSQGTSADTGSLVMEQATALFLAGRGRDAEDLVHTQLPRIPDPQLQIQLRLLALHSMVNRANTGAALAEVQNLLDQAQLPEAASAALRGTRAWVLLLAGELKPAAAELAKIDALLQAAGRPPTEVAPSARAMLAYLHARPVSALQILPSTRNPLIAYSGGTEATYEVWPPIFELFAHGPRAARQASIRARAITAQRGAPWLFAFHDWISAVTDLHSGDWDDAQAALDSGLDTAREFGTGWTATPVGIRALILGHRGQLSQARQSLDAFDRTGQPIQFGLDYCALARLVVHEADAVATYRADPSESLWAAGMNSVRAEAAALWRTARARGGVHWMLTAGPYLARIGDQTLRENIAGAVADTDLSQTGWLGLTREHLVGAAQQNHTVVADAATQLAELGLVLEAAFSKEEAGLLAARNGEPAFAATQLRSAADGYNRLGAATDLDRLRARAHRLGVRLTTGASRRLNTTGWQALTPTELTVAGLVRDGMTNPAIAAQLYLSPRTVQTHVSHILQKTGLRSRVEVAAALAT